MRIYIKKKRNKKKKYAIGKILAYLENIISGAQLSSIKNMYKDFRA